MLELVTMNNPIEAIDAAVIRPELAATYVGNNPHGVEETPLSGT